MTQQSRLNGACLAHLECVWCIAGELTQDDFGCVIQTVCDSLHLLGILPIISQDDIDDMILDAFSLPDGRVRCVPLWPLLIFLERRRCAVLLCAGRASTKAPF